MYPCRTTLTTTSIDLVKHTTLFRQRFNQSIRDALSMIGLHTRKTLYTRILKLFRHNMAAKTEESVTLVQGLHRFAVVMNLPIHQVLTAESYRLVAPTEKDVPRWMKNGAIADMYGDVATEEAMRVLHLTATLKVNAETVTMENADLGMLDQGAQGRGHGGC